MHLKMSDQLVRQGAVELVFGLTSRALRINMQFLTTGLILQPLKTKKAPGNAGAF